MPWEVFPQGQHIETVAQRELHLKWWLKLGVCKCHLCGTGVGGMEAVGLKGSLEEAEALQCERSGDIIGTEEIPERVLMRSQGMAL